MIGWRGRYLFMERAGAHAAGTWSVPGGRMEYGETWSSTAHRETEEETGLIVTGHKLIGITNDVFEADRQHWVTLFIECRMVPPDQTPEIREPGKCTGMEWLTPEEAWRRPLMKGTKQIIATLL